MVIYKYIEEFYKEEPGTKKFCKEHNIVYFAPTKKLKTWLEKWLETAKLPVIGTEHNIICYWRYFGTWGMYHPKDNSISICPYKIENAPGGLEGVIKHEIKHLQHPEADNMRHEEKENYIENISK
jgi:predicted SprT family Zn-dependent metalloprotease